MTVLKTEGQKYWKTAYFQKCTTVNTGCDVKQLQRHSEMNVIIVSHLSQSGMRLIKLQ